MSQHIFFMTWIVFDQGGCSCMGGIGNHDHPVHLPLGLVVFFSTPPTPCVFHTWNVDPQPPTCFLNINQDYKRFVYYDFYDSRIFFCSLQLPSLNVLPSLKLTFSHLKHGWFGILSRFLLGVRPIFRCELAVSFRGCFSIFFPTKNPAIQTDLAHQGPTPHTSQVGKGILPCVEDHLEFLDVSWHRYTDVCISLGSWYTWYPWSNPCFNNCCLNGMILNLGDLFVWWFLTDSDPMGFITIEAPRLCVLP